MNDTSGNSNIVAEVEAFRAMLRDEVNAILSDKAPKSPISAQELQNRLDSYLRHQLAEDMQSSDLPPVAEFQALGKPVEKITIADACEDKAKRIQSEIISGENYDDNFNKAIFELTKLGVLEPSEITNENAQSIVKAFMVMQVKLNKILSARYNGDYGLEQQLCPNIQANILSSTNIIENNANKQPTMLLSELIEKYIETNLADGKWEPQTISDRRSRVTALQVIIGNKEIDRYNRTDMRKFRNILLKLPRNWRKRYNGSNQDIQSLLDVSDNEKKLTPKTINVHIEAVSSLFLWAIKEGFLTANPARGLTVKDDQPDIDKREAFTLDDVDSIFFSGDYVINNFKKPSYYWAPLIALYTGMRLEEICQLHIEDIYKEDGIYIIDIRRESTDGLNDKILKTNNAIRKIPIHNKLIELGFISYHKKLMNKGEIRLFPELNKTERSPKYGKQVGKKFSDLVKKKGISGGKTFHSLRHTFSDFFKKRELHTDMFREVFGHDNEELAAHQYGSRFTPKEIYDKLISLIDFGEKQ